MNENKAVMNVKILGEYGFDEAMLAIAMNKKKYDRDMYPVSKKLAIAGPGHDKFLEMIAVYIDYTTTRSIHQQMDTYRVGVTKSSESTHHMLIEDVLESCINRKAITDQLVALGFTINKEKCVDGLVPINNTALIIAKMNNNILTQEELKEYIDKYLITNIDITNDAAVKTKMYAIFINNFKIDYDHYYSMFEGGAEAITKDTVDKMIELAMTLDEDRYGKLHKLKRMLPEGFLQRRIMSCNYQVLKTIIKQRFSDPFDAWRMFCREIIMQVKHPEYFQDIFDKYHTSKEELANNIWNGKPYIQGY